MWYDTFSDIPESHSPTEPVSIDDFRRLFSGIDMHSNGSAIVSVTKYAHTDDQQWGRGFYMKDGQTLHARTFPKTSMIKWFSENRIPMRIALRSTRSVPNPTGEGSHIVARCTVYQLFCGDDIGLPTPGDNGTITLWRDALLLLQRNVPIAPVTVVNEAVCLDVSHRAQMQSVHSEMLRLGVVCSESNIGADVTNTHPRDETVHRGGFRIVQSRMIFVKDAVDHTTGTFAECTALLAAALVTPRRVSFLDTDPSKDSKESKEPSSKAVSPFTMKSWTSARRGVLRKLDSIFSAPECTCGALGIARTALTGATLSAMVRLLATRGLEAALPSAMHEPSMFPLVVSMCIRFATISGATTERFGKPTPTEALALDELRTQFESNWAPLPDNQACATDAIVAFALQSILQGRREVDELSRHETGQSSDQTATSNEDDTWNIAHYFVQAGRHLAADFYDLARLSNNMCDYACHDTLMAARLSDVKRQGFTANMTTISLNTTANGRVDVSSLTNGSDMYGLTSPPDLNRTGAESLLRILNIVENALRTGNYSEPGWRGNHLQRGVASASHGHTHSPSAPPSLFAGVPSLSYATESSSQCGGADTVFLDKVWSSVSNDFTGLIQAKDVGHGRFLASCITLLWRSFRSGYTAAFRSTGMQLFLIAAEIKTPCLVCKETITSFEASMPFHGNQCTQCDRFRCAKCTVERVDCEESAFVCTLCSEATAQR